jgi:hypothetical protein
MESSHRRRLLLDRLRKRQIYIQILSSTRHAAAELSSNILLPTEELELQLPARNLNFSSIPNTSNSNTNIATASANQVTNHHAPKRKLKSGEGGNGSHKNKAKRVRVEDHDVNIINTNPADHPTNPALTPTETDRQDLSVAAPLLARRDELSKALAATPLARSNPPLVLPCRQQVQWDVVLDEMRSLAADFINERKWKLAVVKSTCRELIHTNTDGSVKSSNIRLKPRRRISIPTPIQPERDIDMSNRSNNRSCQKQSQTTQLQFQSPTQQCPSHALASSLYADATAQDRHSAQILSHSLAIAVSDYWHTFSGGRRMQCKSLEHDSHHNNADYLGRLVAMRSTTVCNHDHGSYRPLLQEHPTAIATTRQEPKQPPFQTVHTLFETRKKLNDGRIVATAIDETDILHKLKSYIQLAQRLKIPKEGPCNHPSGCKNKRPTTLTTSQCHAIQYIRNIWKESHSTFHREENPTPNCITAVLGGDFGTGKSSVACTLLWERRCEGCQLVLCPPGSLVRWSVMLV